MNAAKMTRDHNGYFEVWQMPCGHEVRVNTEGHGYLFKTNREFKRKIDAGTKARLTEQAKCRDCREVTV